MKTFLKSIDINKFTTKITLEHGSTAFYDHIKDEVEAIGILLGNLNGQIGQERYDELRKKFDELINETIESIK